MFSMSAALASLALYFPREREGAHMEELRDFYDRIGAENGWDFSRVKCIAEGVKWDFYDEVAKRCRKSNFLLDIGTGGGERLLSLADAALLLVGIDNAAGMVETAQANAAASGKANVRILPMDAKRIEFPDGFFDVASCRQAPFFAAEAARVLKSGGVFLTQQVSEGDKRNLAEAFGRSQTTAEDGALRDKYVGELTEAGFREIRTMEYDAAEYYETAEDLVFLLMHTPIVPDFGKIEGDFTRLHRFIAEHRTGRGIRTNAKRFMISARK